MNYCIVRPCLEKAETKKKSKQLCLTISFLFLVAEIPLSVPEPMWLLPKAHEKLKQNSLTEDTLYWVYSHTFEYYIAIVWQLSLLRKQTAQKGKHPPWCTQQCQNTDTHPLIITNPHETRYLRTITAVQQRNSLKTKDYILCLTHPLEQWFSTLLML